MFRKWRLRNFKSVYETTELLLPPLTIFAGANSSGKSTFIQSMLVIAQSVTNPVYQRPIILNGHIARLGAFNDLASKGSGSSQISIGFDLSLLVDDQPRSTLRRRSGTYALSLGQGISSLTCDLSFSATDEAVFQLQPRLDKCAVRVDLLNKEPSILVEIRHSDASIEDREAELELSPEYLDPNTAPTLAYEVIEPKDYQPGTSARMYYEGPGGEPVGCGLFHFLPNQLSLRYDAVKEEAASTVRMLTNPARAETRDDPFVSLELLRRIASLLGEYLKAPNAVQSWRRKEVESVLNDLQEQPSIAQIQKLNSMLPGALLRTFYADYREELLHLARRGRPPRWALSLAPPPSRGTVLVQYFFGELFHYLGPLRDEPKAAYPMEGARSPTDVGLRGEFTAAVLDLHRLTLVRYIPSSCFEDGSMGYELKEVPLQEAVLDWLRYLGVVQELQTRDIGLFGHELKVSVGPDDSLHNLVHVGVGVSQVLPILVMSLLADHGAVLVFEQPELHLNPKVQTLLGDFFLSMMWSRKQCIVETHSEYIINRLRYRSVTDETDETAKKIGIYFVEKTGRNSSYRLVNVNEFGAIGDWPKGFFDQSPEEAERILVAALAKRRRRRGDV